MGGGQGVGASSRHGLRTGSRRQGRVVWLYRGGATANAPPRRHHRSLFIPGAPALLKHTPALPKDFEGLLGSTETPSSAS